jgi:hypothetical protein
MTEIKSRLQALMKSIYELKNHIANGATYVEKR